MSNDAKRTVSPTTLLRRARKDAKEQLQAKSNEITDLTNRLETTNDQLQNANEVINRQDDTIAEQRGRIIGLVGDVAGVAQDMMRLHNEAEYLLEKQATKAKACFGVIEAIATEQVSKNDIIVLVTHLATLVPDELLKAAETAFKDLLQKRKAEREAYNAIAKAAPVDYRAHDDFEDESENCAECASRDTCGASTARNGSGSLVVGDKDTVRRLLSQISPTTGNEIMELLRRDLKIQAIKVVREATGASLLDSKNTVETIQNGMKKIAQFGGHNIDLG